MLTVLQEDGLGGLSRQEGAALAFVARQPQHLWVLGGLLVKNRSYNEEGLGFLSFAAGKCLCVS